MAENKIRLRIVTPTGELYNDDATMVVMRGVDGDLGVLKGHQPFTTILDYGLLRVKNNDKETVATVFGGFVDIQPEMVTILTDSAEWIENIDTKRAQEAKQRAENRLKDTSTDLMRAELALKRATIRLSSKK